MESWLVSMMQAWWASMGRRGSRSKVVFEEEKEKEGASRHTSH